METFYIRYFDEDNQEVDSDTLDREDIVPFTMDEATEFAKYASECNGYYRFSIEEL
jgi:hypothetical protein